MIANKSALLCLFSLLASASAWTTTQPGFRTSTALRASLSRDDFLKSMAVAVGGSLVAAMPMPALAETLPSGVTYTVKKSGNGPKPEVGELVAIRFAAYAGDNKIDDIFDTPEPYYTRIGSGGLLKGVESTIPLMRVGDRWELTIPVSVLESKKASHSETIAENRISCFVGVLLGRKTSN
jgi:hypothetical protein